MSCIHSVCNCYCTLHQKACGRPCSPRCKDYCNEQTAVELKKELNKGPATNTNCACGANNSTAENDYVSMLERFINKLYTDHNFGFFGFTSFQAEQRTAEEMKYLGYNTEMVNKALVDTINTFKTNHTSCILRLDSFCNSMLMKPHKDYANYYSTNVRFVLTIILAYLNKLDDNIVLLVDNPRLYLEAKLHDISMREFMDALDKTRSYVEASEDNNLAEGMRIVGQWVEELTRENILPKEVTIADIEKQLGYKIKIVGE